jgi:hypothetical protein
MQSTEKKMRIKISTEAPDSLSHECLVLGLFSDERPPRGNTGFIDWRLNGVVSRYLAEGKITGAFEEKILIASHGRIPSHRIFLFGLGILQEITYERLHDAGAGIGQAMHNMKCSDFALEIPAVGRTDLDVTQMVETIASGLSSFLPEEEMGGIDFFPCILTDEHLFQKVLLGLHKFRLNVKDRFCVDISIGRPENQTA